MVAVAAPAALVALVEQAALAVPVALAAVLLKSWHLEM
jgi:hypothetical protein